MPDSDKLAIAAHLHVLLRRKTARSKTSGINNLNKVLPKQQAWKRHIAVGAAVLSLAALNVAFAKPSSASRRMSATSSRSRSKSIRCLSWKKR